MIGIERKFLRASQAALEFLLTYGWAIMVFLVVVGSLSYFGVLSTDSFLPNKCSLPSGISCLDYEVGTSSINLVLQNNFAETIAIDRIDVAKKDSDSCSYAQTVNLKNNAKAIFTVSGCNNGKIGEKFDGQINVTYVKESSLSHQIMGNIHAKITEITAASSFNLCQNADSNGLCDGLDILFGEGYKAACCSEHSLCCS